MLFNESISCINFRVFGAVVSVRYFVGRDVCECAVKESSSVL